MNNLPESPMIRALAACVAAGVPAAVDSDPGEGKTARISQLARAWGRHLETIAASSREAVDFLGLPLEDPEHGWVVNSPLQWAVRLNQAERSLLFIDEYTTAGSAFKPLLRLTNERVVGDYELGEHVSIVVAFNPPDIATDGQDIPAANANRFIFLSWAFDANLWLDNVGTDFRNVTTADPATYLTRGTDADRARVTAQVTGYLRTSPQSMKRLPEGYEEQGRAWPSPRSWTNLIKALTYVRPDDLDARDLLIKGAVGNAEFSTFIAWLNAFDLVDPAVALDAPESISWNSLRPDQVYAVLSGVQVLVAGSDALWTKGTKVVEAVAAAGRADAALPLMRALLNNPKGAVSATLRNAYAEVFEATGRWKKAA